MEVGMLWFDNDKYSDLTSKIENAADYYLNKYGICPNVCFVNPCMTSTNNNEVAKSVQKKAVFKAGNIEVKTTQSVLPNHLWIGINSSKNKTTS